MEGRGQNGWLLSRWEIRLLMVREELRETERRRRRRREGTKTLGGAGEAPSLEIKLMRGRPGHLVPSLCSSLCHTSFQNSEAPSVS